LCVFRTTQTHVIFHLYYSKLPYLIVPGYSQKSASEYPDGTGIKGGGSGYAALLAHAEGALYGTELGSVTLKRIGFFCFPIKHSTHRRKELCTVRNSAR
jgi:hypothetical protein